MAPESASTATNFSPQRVKIRAVNRIVQVEALVQPRLVDVEGVAVLHDELAHAQQPRLRPRLIAELGLDLVPDLRQLLVAAQFAARDGGHDLFVRHAQAELGALAVLQAKHVVAHSGPAAALLPRLAGQNAGQEELLPDLVHLFADDADDLVQRALPEEEVVVNARAELANVTGPQQELVAGHFGVCRGLAKGRNKELGPTMHRKECGFPVQYRRTWVQMTAIPILNVQVETGWRTGFCGLGARPNLTDEIDAYQTNRSTLTRTIQPTAPGYCPTAWQVLHSYPGIVIFSGWAATRIRVVLSRLLDAFPQ